MHRPTNVDDKNKLKKLIRAIVKNSNSIPIIFPAHPRTKKNLNFLKRTIKNLYEIDPLPYLEFNFLVENAKVVITDSGGITEEATVLNIPCLTLRDSTERPETIDMGTNELIGSDEKRIATAMKKIFLNKWKKCKIPPLWDGKTSERIINRIIKLK